MGVSARTLEKMVARGRTQEMRETIRDERAEVADVKRDRRARLQAITEQCRAMRATHGTDAKRQRVELRAAIEHARSIIKDKCAKARGKTDEETAGLLLVALGELEEAREQLRRYLSELKLPPKDPGKVRGGVRAAEIRAEVIGEVAYNLEAGGAPELVPVWHSMARRMPKRYQASAHRSATEGFVEWASDHGSTVLAIQEKGLERDIKDLVGREEEERRDLHEAAEKKRKRELRKLMKVTAASARKLDDDQALDRFEDIRIALQNGADDETVAKLRRAVDVLQVELLRRGLFEDFTEETYEALPDEPLADEAPF